jgi:serine/threonine-protein kinase mTOR
MVRAQMLSELEEIMLYRQSAEQPERQATIRKTWIKRYIIPVICPYASLRTPRILGCQSEVDIWQRILRVRSLVLEPEDNSQILIKFANLCRKNGRMVLAEKTINSLLPENVSEE